MKKILQDIQTGKFAKEWILENAVGRPEYNRRKHMEENHLIEVTGKKLRKMMKWLNKKFYSLIDVVPTIYGKLDS